MLEGFPPTYAQEVERMGHAGITTNTSPNDPAYLAIIAAQLRWERVNPSIADIYTMRKLPDGHNALIVDSETDYDRNGKFEGDREQRTPIGEVYEKQIPALEQAFAGTPAFMDEPYSDRWGNWVSAFVPMRDAQGRVEAVLGVDYPGANWIHAKSRARLNAMSIVCILAIFLGASSTVIALLRADLRNRKLAEQRVSQMNSELEQRVRERTAELESTHQKLLDASRKAGMAEVATSVLHNVGNVLNSVNIASSCVADSLRKSKAANLFKLVALLQEHEPDLGGFFTNDPKARQVPVYLAQLAKHLAGEQAEALKELAQLQKNIEHINDIVTMQQGLAKTSGVTETVNVTELVEDALRINLSGLARHDIEVIKEFKDTPLVTVEKHKVLQILVNLVRNAKHACEASDLQERELTIRTTNGADRVRIAVCDNGVGIPPENLIHIFSHGFTTKKDGHGFGLHSGALAAKEMGGSLAVQSDGPGKGATFTLELPQITPASDTTFKRRPKLEPAQLTQENSHE
jgi:signal transduction histidine kinase